MTYDYGCHNCGVIADKQVTSELRDEQFCECGTKLERLPHFHTIGFSLPPEMKSGYDIRNFLSDEPERAREEVKKIVYGDRRKRSDLI